MGPGDNKLTLVNMRQTITWFYCAWNNDRTRGSDPRHWRIYAFSGLNSLMRLLIIRAGAQIISPTVPRRAITLAGNPNMYASKIGDGH